MTTSIFSLGDQPYFIAEVGQNHQGSVSIATEYIHIFAAAGADAIKFRLDTIKICSLKTLIMPHITVKMPSRRPTVLTENIWNLI